MAAPVLPNSLSVDYLAALENYLFSNDFDFPFDLVVRLLDEKTSLDAVCLIHHDSFCRILQQRGLDAPAFLVERAGAFLTSVMRVYARRTDESEAEFADILDFGGFTTWKWSKATDRIEFSEGLLRFYQPTDEKRAEKPDFETGRNRVHPDDLSMLRTMVEGAFQWGVGFERSYRVIAEDGSERFRHLKTVVRRDAEGAFIGVFGISRDITGDVTNETNLKKGEISWRDLFEGNPFPQFVYDPVSFDFLAFNTAAIHTYGYSPTEFKNLSVLSLFPEADRTLLTDRLGISGDGAFTEEWQHRRKNGDMIEVRHTSRPIFFKDRNVRLVVVQDLTPQKKSAEALLESQRKLILLEAAIENATDVVLITEADFTDPPGPRIVYVNQAFTKMTGYGVEEAIGLPLRILFGPGTLPETTAILQRAMQEFSPVTVQVLNYRKDGSEFWAELSIVPVPDASGNLAHWVGIQRDITERRYTSERIRRLEKMNAIGQLTGGVAHNFNNMLMIIQGFSELIAREAHLPQPLLQKNQAILKAARRAGDIVGQLLAFSQVDQGESGVFDLDFLVTDSASLLERLLPPDVRLKLKLSGKTLLTRVDSGQFSHALINLMTNARDAMPHGGELVVETGAILRDSAHDVSSTKTLISENVPGNGPYVFVSVTDTGIGMDAMTMDRVFEPFFSTKPRGAGTGLGLATVYGFVNLHHGFIEVVSFPGRGTTFRLFFPTAEIRAEKPVLQVLQPTEELFSSLTALVVDIAADHTNLPASWLTELGFTVLQPENGPEARRYAFTHPGPIHLVVMREGIPESEIADLIGFFEKTRPECFILLVRDLPGTPTSPVNVPSGGTILDAPFSKEEFIQTVRQVFI